MRVSASRFRLTNPLADDPELTGRPRRRHLDQLLLLHHDPQRRRDSPADRNPPPTNSHVTDRDDLGSQ